MSFGTDAQDLSSMWTKRLRELARSAEIYGCPFCEERKIFSQEKRLFEHAEANHKDMFDAAAAKGPAVLAAFRDDLRMRARARGGTGAGAFRSKAQTRSTPNQEPPNSSRPTSAGTPTVQGQGTPRAREIGDIQQLSLHRDQETSLAPLGPRKRAAGPDPWPAEGGPQEGPSQRLTASEDDNATSPRRSKARAGSGSQHAFASTADPDSRPTPGSHSRLFDPNTDDAVPRTSKDTSTAPGRAAVLLRQQDRSPGHGSRARFQLNRDVSRKPGKAPAIGGLNIPPHQPDFSMRSSMEVAHDREAAAQDPEAAVERGPPRMAAKPASPVPSAGQGQLAEIPVRQPHALLQPPETRRITHEKLVSEVKTIYRGLAMVEAKCVEVVSKQVAAGKGKGRPPKLTDEQWRALVALHRNLLYDHHDFFLASQHPSASPALCNLAKKYAMPARMWRHGILSFLELLRHRLPDALEHMLAFIYLAYSMVALLYESVPSFKDTWVECLGDLARYRMAIEDEDLRDRETWTGVARFWYSKAADKDPTVGRLYHHLAILARPDALRQLYFYSRSLTCSQPFLSARESALTLFDPVLKGSAAPAHHRPLPSEEHFVKAHGILFTGSQLDKIDRTIEDYLAALDKVLDRVTAKWKEQGVFIAVANAAALFEYGSTNAELKLAFDARKMDEEIRRDEAAGPGGPANRSEPATSRPASEPDFRSSVQLAVHSAEASNAPTSAAVTPAGQQQPPPQQPEDEGPGVTIDLDPTKGPNIRPYAARLTFATLDLALQRIGDANIMPYVHVTMVLVWSMASVPGALEPLETDVPWDRLVSYLNALARPERFDHRLLGPDFPTPKDPQEHIRPLREDYLITGQIWTERYFPEGWFERAKVDDDERELELPSMAEPRLERVLWLSVRIATYDHWLQFDKESFQFSVAPTLAPSQPYPDPRPSGGVQAFSPVPDTDDEGGHSDDAGEDGDGEMSDPAEGSSSMVESRPSQRAFTPAASVPTEEVRGEHHSSPPPLHVHEPPG